jgi:hypothetical protein
MAVTFGGGGLTEESPFKPPEQESEYREPPPKDSRDSYRLGVLFGFLAHTLLFLVFPFLGVFALLLVGVVQVIYQVPLYLIMRHQGLHRMGSGLWLATAITFLLNAGICGVCYGVLIIEGY